MEKKNVPTDTEKGVIMALLDKAEKGLKQMLSDDKKDKPKYEPKKFVYDIYKSYDAKGICQTLPQTRKNRFPKIFDTIKQLKPDAERILSFGCASGEEVEAIKERFPNSQIIGFDIDRFSIEKARRNYKNLPNVYFTDEVGGTGKYDIVLVLMVLFRLEKPLSQELWKTTLEKVEKCVKPGGLCVIYTSEYNPKEVLGDKYKVIKEWEREHNKNKKMYWCGYYKKKRKWFG